MNPRTQKAAALAIAASLVAGGIAWDILHRQSARSGPVATEVPSLKSISVPQSDPQATGLRSEIKEILNSSTPARKRIELLRDTAIDLSEPEINALLGEVSAVPNSDADQAAHVEYLHEICHLLRKIPAARERLSRVLAGIAADSGRQMIVRDYAIQHLRQLWALAKEEPELRQGIRKSFEELVHADAAVTGPALLSLHVLGGSAKSKGGEISDAQIQPLVAEILAKKPDTPGIPAAIAAVRITGDRHLTDLSPRLREIAADSSIHALVRMAAVSVISADEPSSLAFLATIDRNDPRVDEAVRIALRKAP